MKNISSALTMALLFTFVFACKKTTVPPPELPTFPNPNWQTDATGKYPVSMTAVVSLPTYIIDGLDDADKVGAFINDECRGVGVQVKVNSANVFYILIHGTASEQQKIKFKYYSAKTSHMYETQPFLDFTADSNYGSPDLVRVLDLLPIR